MTNPRIREIKHAQKESMILHEVSQNFVRIAQDEPSLQSFSITRVSLSDRKGFCIIFFHTLGGLKEFEEKRKTLVLYKPSLRQALSKAMHGRYVPQIRFKYDDQLDKQRRIDDLIDKLKAEGKL